jgi:arsenite-transporting ATPase
MARIILVAGKGGVGKTTVAAATALAGARRGHRTLVMSLDIAHSLADAFDLDGGLFDQHDGAPLRVAEGLDLQEIDVQAEIGRHWGEIFRYLASVFTATGLDGVVAEEMAILPGTEDVLALSYINTYVTEGAYDLIVLDAPPTAESLRFVSLYTTLEWYMRRRFQKDRRLMRVAGPLLERLAELPLPDEAYFAGVQRLFKGLEHVDALLTDPRVTTVRLVTNAEKMVIRETQRAYMYFNLYGMTTDQVIVNRLLPAGGAGETGDGFLAPWREAQAGYLDAIRDYFQPVPVAILPLFAQEVLGAGRLGEVASALYGEGDPAERYSQAPPYELRKRGGRYALRLRVPAYVDAAELDVTRVQEDVVIRLAGFKRSIPLPRAVRSLRTAGATVNDGYLEISFAE